IAGLVADIQTGEQVCVSNIDASGDDLTGERRAFESSTTGLVFRDVRQLNIADAVSWEGYQPWRPGSPFRSALVTPVMIDDRAVAAIAVYAMRPAAFDTDDE